MSTAPTPQSAVASLSRRVSQSPESRVPSPKPRVPSPESRGWRRRLAGPRQKEHHRQQKQRHEHRHPDDDRPPRATSRRNRRLERRLGRGFAAAVADERFVGDFSSALAAGHVSRCDAHPSASRAISPTQSPRKPELTEKNSRACHDWSSLRLGSVETGAERRPSR